MAGTVSPGAAPIDERIVAAHEALRADRAIQWDMRGVDPPQPPPQWLRDFLEWLGKVLEPVGRFFHWIGSFLPDAPYARIILWTVIALAAAALVWMIVERIRSGEWRLPRWRRRSVLAAAEVDAEPGWTPPAAAREWLAEADALAARGLFAEAVHLLLLRSVEDVARRRPELVRPALTSRDLARAEGVPAPARSIFARIAAVVERSLFGGRPVLAPQWAECRAAYAEFAEPRSWRG
jgi:hypothetical protein